MVNNLVINKSNIMLVYWKENIIIIINILYYNREVML